MNEENYKKISDWFRENKSRFNIFVFLYRILPIIVFFAYGSIIFYFFFWGSGEDTLRLLIVPAATFLLCTIFRKVINKKRPYEALNINPLIQKEKKGQSFPSRHMVSAGVIAMAAMYTDIVFGIIILVIGMLIGIIRPIAGVHYIWDVAAGFAMGILCGIIGFYLI